MALNPHKYMKQSLATKLIKIVLFFYILITVIVTAVHMIAEYENMQKDLQAELGLLEKTFSPIIANAVWALDMHQIRSTAEGIVTLPFVVGIKILDERDKEILKVGITHLDRKSFTKLIWHKFPIYYEDGVYRDFSGTVLIASSSEIIIRRVKYGFLFIIFSSAVKVIALYCVFLVVIRKFLGKPLAALTEATENLDFEHLSDQEVNIGTTGQDELKSLEQAFNSMIKKLSLSLQRIRSFNTELEERVKERTFELRKAKKEADAAARAKSDFLANMSHEIRTPMNGVIAAADLALNLEASPQMERYLKIIHSSGNSLLGIINDILDFSKIEAGKLQLENTQFNIHKLIDNILHMFINKTQANGVELLLDLDMKLPKVLHGDSLRVRQIITNLLANAVKFTDQGGTITIGVEEISAKRAETDRIRGEDLSAKTLLKFYIKDTGTGIKAEIIDKLFEPFTQADASTTRKFGGTGLGLTICKQLVEMMNGAIWAESEFGKGTIFYFIIAFDQLQLAEEEPSQLRLPTEMRGCKVLVVDDIEDSRIIIQKILTSFQYRVETAASGYEALQVLRESQQNGSTYSLIVMDWLMPELDGIKTSQLIREELKLDIPIIMMTSFGKKEERLSAAKAGIDVFLTKPINALSLYNTIMRVSGKGEYAVEECQFEEDIQRIDIKEHIKWSRILVAEDNLTNQEIIKAILENAQIEIDIVDNGREAIEKLSEKSYDAILMDMQMPEMDGYEATEKIRMDSRHKNLPIIAMTAHAMKGDMEKCMAAGMNGYVSKPINQAILFETIAKLLPATKRSKPSPDVGQESPNAEDTAFDHPSQKLPDCLPGINIRKALDDLGIDETTYLTVLKGFLKNSYSCEKELWALYAARAFQALKEKAHGIKGSSANIGATRLYQTAMALEMKSKDESVTEKDLKAFESDFQELRGSLNKIIPKANRPEPSLEKPFIAPVKLTEYFNALIQAIEESDPERIHNAMQDLGPYVDGDQLASMQDQIDEYDYDLALETLHRIAEKVGISLTDQASGG